MLISMFLISYGPRLKVLATLLLNFHHNLEKNPI